MANERLVCPVCFRHCALSEGEKGYCGARQVQNGKLVDASYGRLSALALDPIEKKPLARFHPGSMVVSVGSFGCNLNCPFCQNHVISRKTDAFGTTGVSPAQLLAIVEETKKKDPRTIGAAYTYNEPMTFYEYVRDAAKLLHEHGYCNVLVTNGTAEQGPLEEILPYIDAMNIDLKSADAWTYQEILGGCLSEVEAFIQRAAASCHVEVTTLLVPGINDSEEEVRKIASFLREVDGKGEIPLHLSRFFPRYRMEHTPATDVAFIYRMRDVAGTYLKYVYTGNC